MGKKSAISESSGAGPGSFDFKRQLKMNDKKLNRAVYYDYAISFIFIVSNINHYIVVYPISKSHLHFD
jgi:hypothetical protein